MESVAEFRIQSSLAPAEFAQAGGAVVDVVTKSGSQAFTETRSSFSRTKPPMPRASSKCPACRAASSGRTNSARAWAARSTHSTFFFATYEGLRGKSASATQHLVPDAPVRAGDFTGRNLIFDPLSLDASGNAHAVSRTTSFRQPHRSDRREIISSSYEPLPNLPGNPAEQLHRLDAQPEPQRQRLDARRSCLGRAQPAVRALHDQRRTHAAGGRVSRASHFRKPARAAGGDRPYASPGLPG